MKDNKNLYMIVKKIYDNERKEIQRLNELWDYDTIENPVEAQYYRQLIGSLKRKQELLKLKPMGSFLKDIYLYCLQIEIYKSRIIEIKYKHKFEWIENNRDEKELKTLIYLIREINARIKPYENYNALFE